MSSFADRLQWAMQKGNLTGADLARWFDCPDPTIRGWLAGMQPTGAPGDVAQIEAALARLEKLIKAQSWFPVPRLTRQARIAYLENLRQKAS